VRLQRVLFAFGASLAGSLFAFGTADATTVTFGPKLPATIAYNIAIAAHNAPEEQWEAFGAFEEEGAGKPAAPFSGTLSQVQLEYGTESGADTEVWIAEPSGKLVSRVASKFLEPTIEPGHPCGANERIETFNTNLPINAGQILVVTNSGEGMEIFCAFPSVGIASGWHGSFGESAPVPDLEPAKWVQWNYGVLMDGTVTTEPRPSEPPGGTGAPSEPGGGSSSSTPSPQQVARANCGAASLSACPEGEVQIGRNIYRVTITPAGNVIYTKLPTAFEIEPHCEGHGVFWCGGETAAYCTCSVPFGTVSREHARKPIVYGHARFRIHSGHSGRVRIRLTSSAVGILKHKHSLRTRLVTTLKLPGGRHTTSSLTVTVKLR